MLGNNLAGELTVHYICPARTRSKFSLEYSSILNNKKNGIVLPSFHAHDCY